VSSGPNVIVAGDGPAGVSVALRLAASGVQVWLLARKCRAPAPIGETLPPQIKNEIAKLGASPARVGVGALESYGIEARWGGGEHFHSNLLDPHGNGWHVDHATLCANLLREARAVGVHIVDATTIAHAEHYRAQWRVRMATEGIAREVTCRFIVDATGRAAALGRFVGIRRRRVDALCGVAAVYPRPAMPRTLRVVSVPYGWWYASPLPGDRVLACLMSDGDIIRDLDAHQAGWNTLLSNSGLMGDGFVPSVGGRRQVLPCETSILQEVTGSGWAAVGDAACVFEPLASAGVVKALHTGRTAADAIWEYLCNGSVTRLNGYAHQVSRDFDRYLTSRRVQYAAERQWQHLPFWMRRH